jgi:hypothetical protein
MGAPFPSIGRIRFGSTIAYLRGSSNLAELGRARFTPVFGRC